MGKRYILPVDEADRLELQERHVKRLRRTLLCAIALLMAGGIAGAYFVRDAAFLPTWTLVSPTPSPAPTPDVAPSPAVSANVQVPPSPALTAVLKPAAIYIDGNLAGVIASREAAAALISDVCAYFESEADGIGLPDTSVMNDVVFKDATPDEQAQLSTAEALYAAFIGENSPLSVMTLLTCSYETNVPCETITQTTKYLLSGTQLIVRLGKVGSTHEVTVTRYINGLQEGDAETATGSITDPVDGLILIGTQEPDYEAVPGKREGQAGPDAGELTFIQPVELASIERNYGQYKGVLHLGLDYAADEGEPVLASCPGTIVCVMERGSYGLMVEIDHGNGFVTRYAHLSGVRVSLGDVVRQGDAIGTTGCSGSCAHPLLHFEIRVDGIAYNPRFYLDS